jgi:glutathione S-transferase
LRRGVKEDELMKLYVLPPSPRTFKVIALKNHLGVECEIEVVDLAKDEHLTPEFTALNPNRKVPMLEDNGFILWESNAILFYLASKKPASGMWPSETREQADAMRWLSWESAHWDQQVVGQIGFELISKRVLRLGSPDPSRIEDGRRQFDRFAPVLDTHLRDRKWLVGDCVTIADFSVGAWIPSIRRQELPIVNYPNILRWCDNLAALPAWNSSMAPTPV